MRISRIRIENFRNFESLELALGQSIVIIGENKSGKSNLVHALRLVLDPSLPDSARYLRDEDFWDGLSRPLSPSASVLIAVDLADFESDDNQVALLAEYLVSGEPMIARLTYVYRPRPEADSSRLTMSDYEFSIYGGEREENLVRSEVRRRLPFEVLHALRDAEGDLAAWRRSPLRPLVETASAHISITEIEQIATDVTEAASAIGALPRIRGLNDRINATLESIVGATNGLDTTLGLSPQDPQKLLRSLRLFIDGGRRGLEEASLGSANVMYLALRLLELEGLAVQNARDHTFLAIEEPEAHLHPYLQRLVYRSLLRSPSDPQFAHRVPTRSSIVLTTHSPHVVSVTPLRSLVLLKRGAAGRPTVAVSTATIDLSPSAIDDLERYIDVTRGELLFARAVLLVEGDAELFLIPAFASQLGVSLDTLGLSICSVSGTHFGAYAKLLGSSCLNLPYAILTDWDPQSDSASLSRQRTTALLTQLGIEPPASTEADTAFREQVAQYGIFLNEHTLEVDLVRSGAHASVGHTLAELGATQSARDRGLALASDPKSLDLRRLLTDIAGIGKGRFAQRLASRVEAGACPTYIRHSLEYLRERSGGA